VAWACAAGDPGLAVVALPAGTLSANETTEARSAFRRGERLQAFRLLRSHIDELIDTDNVIAASVVCIEFITVMTAIDRLAEAAHMLGYLRAANDFGTLAARTLVAEAAEAARCRHPGRLGHGTGLRGPHRRPGRTRVHACCPARTHPGRPGHRRCGTDLHGPTSLVDTAVLIPAGGRYDPASTAPAAPVLDPLTYGAGAPVPWQRFDREFTLVLDRGLDLRGLLPRYAHTVNGAAEPGIPDLRYSSSPGER
jgi:hypothetical protein